MDYIHLIIPLTPFAEKQKNGYTITYQLILGVFVCKLNNNEDCG